MIKDNLQVVQSNIDAACSRSGRDPKEVTLIAVSKTKPIAAIKEAMDCGITQFGENKVQELVDKIETIPEKLQWHMIGHLQRNKVKYIIDKTTLIHSVDSYRLAEQIEEEAAKKDLVCPVLLEVNIADEDTKFGIKPEAVLDLITQISKFQHIKVKGFMTVAPYVENPEKNRVHFRNLRNLYVDIKSKNIDNVDIDILSMGMTNDYEVAIEEGATMIRVGTGIFGERDYR